jgi:hypothetical protein
MAAGDVEGFAAVAFPIVRRVFGGLIANDLISVQPMSLPSGLIFFMDFTHSSPQRPGRQDSSVYGGNVTGKGILDGVTLGSDAGGFYNLNTGYSSPTGSLTVATAGHSCAVVSDGSLDTTTSYDPDLAGAGAVVSTVTATTGDIAHCDPRAVGAITLSSVANFLVGDFAGGDDVVDQGIARVMTSDGTNHRQGDLVIIGRANGGGKTVFGHGADDDAVLLQLRLVRRLTESNAAQNSNGLLRATSLTKLVLEVVRLTDLGNAAAVAGDGDVGNCNTEAKVTTAIGEAVARAASEQITIEAAERTAIAAVIGSIDLKLKCALIDNFAGTANSLGAVLATNPFGLEEATNVSGADPASSASNANKDLIPEIDIKVDSVAVTAQTKKLKAKWTPELGQDLNAYHNLDAEVELTGILSEQIALEIDRELLGELVQGAKAGTRYWSRAPGLFVNSTGTEIGASSAAPDFTGTVSEWYETLIETINDVSAQIHRKTLRGGANFVVCSPEVANILEFTSGFRASVTADQDRGTIGAVKSGSLSKKFDVYVDPYFLRNVLLVGRKGSSFLESGYVYAPYVPLQVTPTIFGTEDFVPRKGVMTRYAKKMVRPDMYGLVIVRGLLGEAGKTA